MKLKLANKKIIKIYPDDSNIKEKEHSINMIDKTDDYKELVNNENYYFSCGDDYKFEIVEFEDLVTIICDDSLPQEEYYDLGEELYIEIYKNFIINKKINRSQLKRFINFLYSLNGSNITRERAQTMAISLSMLSLDKELLDEIYSIYENSDSYEKSFIINLLSDANIYEEDLNYICEEIKNQRFDDTFIYYLSINRIIKEKCT